MVFMIFSITVQLKFLHLNQRDPRAKWQLPAGCGNTLKQVNSRYRLSTDTGSEKNINACRVLYQTLQQPVCLLFRIVNLYCCVYDGENGLIF